MMNVMKADVAAEPSQYSGEIVKGTPFESRLKKIPLLVTDPINSFELMLDVEEPHAEGPSQPKRREHH